VCAALIVCEYPSLKIVYQDYEYAKITVPYCPGFLAFRELPPLVALVDRLRATKPEFTPDIILVDGNGIFHTRSFGLACHLGVTVNIPTIGVGKTVFAVDGINKVTILFRKV
jgi:deoxyinosine 3'endonuclease (endonuclease V)